MEERLDADAVARVLRRAHEIADERGLATDPALDRGGVSPDALIAAANDVGIDPAAVREALAIERFSADPRPVRRLDRLVGPSELIVQRTILRDVDDSLDAVVEWLTSGYQMRCMRIDDSTVEGRPRSGIGASISRIMTEFTDDEDIQPVERIVVEAQSRPGDSSGDSSGSSATMVRITAFRSTTRAWRLGGAAVGGIAGVGAAVAGVGMAAAGVAGSAVWLPVAAIPLLGGGFLIARSGGTHADRVEVELTRVLNSVARSERPTGMVGRAARSVRAAIRSARSNTK